jgi:sugar phosphate isomerase/epimerase
VHDNARDRDSHLWPGEGSIDWAETISLLRTAPQVPPLLMEIEGEEKTDVRDGMQRSFRKLQEEAAGK